MQDSNTTIVPEATVTEPTVVTVPDPVVNTPPLDEGVPDTKNPTDDAMFLKLFGKEAEPFVDEEVVKQVAGMNVTMTDPIKPSDNPLEHKAETPETPINTETPATPVSTEAPVAPTITPDIQNIIDERVAEEVQKFQHINTFFEEYQKDPYKFMATHSPHLFKNFNEVEYVQSKMAEEFGDFTPDPARALQIGTTDYNYVKRQSALEAEALSLKNTAESTLTAEQSAIEQSEQSYKAAKAQALGLDMNTFESRIWAKLKSMSPENVLDLIVDAVIYEGKLKEKDLNIKQQIDLTKGVPSPSNLAGTGRPVNVEDKDGQLLRKMFGDEFD